MEREKIAVWMQRELDHDLSLEEQGKLRKFLLDHPEEREKYRKLEALHRELSSLPQVHLTESLVEQLRKKGKIAKNKRPFALFSSKTLMILTIIFFLLWFSYEMAPHLSIIIFPLMGRVLRVMLQWNG